MKKPILAAALIYTATVMPAFAQAHANKHALGDMYTKALNMIEAGGMLDTLEPKKHVIITNIHMDRGQVFVAMSGDNGSITVTYDPIANKLLYGNEEMK
jgi:hypothetical protein